MRLLCFGSLVIAIPPLAHGQVERATLAGTITDNSGAVVPGVAIKVTNEATNISVNLETDTAGDYRAVNLTPGSYVLRTEKTGFQPYTTKGIILQVAQEARLDIQLELGGVEQTIEVSAAAQLLQTEGSTVGQVIDTKPIEMLPLNGRNLVQLAVLAPGVTGLSYSQTGTINSGARPDELRPGGTTVPDFALVTSTAPPARPPVTAMELPDVLTGPRSANLDLTAAKRFRITESTNLAFRAEFFNALNHPQFSIPGNTTIGSNGVGSITSTARTSRQIQLALRLRILSNHAK